MRRHAFIDHLRIVLTALVIFHHAAIVYGGSGGWYWREAPEGSERMLLLFNAVNQSFFMGFFFLLAGYFTPKSYDRKGTRAFLLDRFLRLGLPLLGYFFVLSPMTIALARTSEGHRFGEGWWLMTRLAEFEPGPLWFAEALLLFALVYAIVRQLGIKWAPFAQVPSFTALALAAVGIAAVSFGVRLFSPVGQQVAWLQLGYFPAYVLLFVVGCRAAQAELLERVTFANAKPWVFLSVLMLFALPVMITTRGGKGAFTGGWNLNAAFYALWDPLIAWGIILTLLVSFRRFLGKENVITAALGRWAYAAYIIHPPVLVGLSLLFRDWATAPLLKFGAVGLLACIGSFAAASVLVLIPGLRRIL